MYLRVAQRIISHWLLPRNVHWWKKLMSLTSKFLWLGVPRKQIIFATKLTSSQGTLIAQLDFTKIISETRFEKTLEDKKMTCLTGYHWSTKFGACWLMPFSYPFAFHHLNLKAKALRGLNSTYFWGYPIVHYCNLDQHSFTFYLFLADFCHVVDFFSSFSFPFIIAFLLNFNTHWYFFRIKRTIRIQIQHSFTFHCHK